MATSLTEFLPDVTPSVPGCPRSLILDAIRNACIRFCEETWIIRETLTAIDVVAGTDVYTLTASTNNLPVGLIHFSYNERDLTFKTEEELDIIDQGWRVADPGTPFFVTSPSPDTFRLNRVPSEAITDGMVPRIATKPTNETSSVDDLLYRDWRDGIRAGALQELKGIPDKGWSDDKAAMSNGQLFNFYIQRGKARAVMGHMRKSTTAKMRQWV